ncbi:hypothetical protein [Nonomuraea sp. NPDC050310]
MMLSFADQLPLWLPLAAAVVELATALVNYRAARRASPPESKTGDDDDER